MNERIRQLADHVRDHAPKLIQEAETSILEAIEVAREAANEDDKELIVTIPIGQTSDGYHTFDELYEHRHALFLCLLSCHAGIFPMWMSKRHDDGTEMPGWFIAGIALPEGTVSYHMPERLWDACVHCGAEVADRAPKWDGHTSADVIARLMKFVQA